MDIIKNFFTFFGVGGIGVFCALNNALNIFYPYFVLMVIMGFDALLQKKRLTGIDPRMTTHHIGT